MGTDATTLLNEHQMGIVPRAVRQILENACNDL